MPLSKDKKLIFSAFQKAVWRTLVYADLFSYPLKKKEIWRRLIQFPCSWKKFQSLFRQIKTKNIQIKQGFYFLAGKKSLVSLRKKREKSSQEKLKIARKIARLIFFLPTVKMVGLTGALAVKNAEEGDDIDFLIITSAGFLWLTRFFVTWLVELTGRRRHPEEKEVKDKICLNLFLDEEHLSFLPKERDLFLAFEISQLQPLYDKGGIYQKFLAENVWMKKYLPNFNLPFPSAKMKKKKTLFAILFFPFEKLFQFFQWQYMKGRVTCEKIEAGRIFFHPENKKRWVEERYRKITS